MLVFKSGITRKLVANDLITKYLRNKLQNFLIWGHLVAFMYNSYSRHTLVAITSGGLLSKNMVKYP